MLLDAENRFSLFRMISLVSLSRNFSELFHFVKSLDLKFQGISTPWPKTASVIAATTSQLPHLWWQLTHEVCYTTEFACQNLNIYVYSTVSYVLSRLVVSDSYI